MKSLSLSNFNLDTTAIFLSILCALHCLFIPLALLFIPSLAAYFFAQESFHQILLFFIIPISTVAMFLGCRKHKRYNIFLYGIIGVLFLLVSAIWGHDLLGESGEIILTIFGSSIISVGHFKNQRHCKDDCHD
tara:strand:+ start:961 stop:1359 length:399 start_codon:yes stop_codon:yes gene_type:complete